MLTGPVVYRRRKELVETNPSESIGDHDSHLTDQVTTTAHGTTSPTALFQVRYTDSRRSGRSNEYDPADVLRSAE